VAATEALATAETAAVAVAETAELAVASEEILKDEIDNESLKLAEEPSPGTDRDESSAGPDEMPEPEMEVVEPETLVDKALDVDDEVAAEPDDNDEVSDSLNFSSSSLTLRQKCLFRPRTNTSGRGKYHCTIDLLFDWFGLVCFANKNKNCQ
jgi:hypothetical protein